MSLNTSHTDGGIMIHQGEVILLHAPAAVLGFSGCDDLKQFTDLNGNCYLTSHRLIFLVKNAKSSLKSFSFPFGVLSEVNVEQPVFGANFIKGKVRAQQNGNWRGEAKFKIKFNSGGAIDFAQGMLRAIHIARQVNANNQMWNTPPPDYAAATATAMPAPMNAYAPAQNYYGWTAPNYNFPPPEAGTIYVMEAPPPYPGIGASQPGFTMPPQPAYAPQAYANGNQAFMPQPPPPYTPSASGGNTYYDGGNKKQN